MYISLNKDLCLVINQTENSRNSMPGTGRAKQHIKHVTFASWEFSHEFSVNLQLILWTWQPLDGAIDYSSNAAGNLFFYKTDLLIKAHFDSNWFSVLRYISVCLKTMFLCIKYEYEDYYW